MIVNYNETKHIRGKKSLPCISNAEKENKQSNLNIPKGAYSGAHGPTTQIKAGGSCLRGAVKL